MRPVGASLIDVWMGGWLMRRSRAAVLVAVCRCDCSDRWRGDRVCHAGRRERRCCRPGQRAVYFRELAAAGAADAEQVADALRKLPDDPQELVASGAQGQVAGRARQAIPPGHDRDADEEVMGAGRGRRGDDARDRRRARARAGHLRRDHGQPGRPVEGAGDDPVAASPPAGAVPSASAS